MSAVGNIALCATLLIAAACSDSGEGVASDVPDERVETGDVAPTLRAPSDDTDDTDDTDGLSGVTGGSQDRAAALYDQTEVHTFDLIVEPDDLAVLDGDPAAEEYVDGFLDFGGERYGPIGVRYKGSIGAFVGCLDGFGDGVPGGAKACTKLSLKLKFDGRYDVDFFGVDKVQLHSQNLDPTMMHERLGYAMFRAFDVPAPRSAHARVTMNGELLGLFALTEQIDEVFVATVFEDDSGNLYKEAWPVADQPRNEDYFRDRLRTNEDEPLPFDPIEQLGQAANGAEEGMRLAAIDPFVDVDAWLRYLVVDRAIGHDDGPLRFDCVGDVCGNKNHYLYQGPSSGEISIIAWDLDSAFATLTKDPSRTDQLVLEVADDWGETSNDCQPFAHGPADLLQRSAACDPVFAAFAEDPDRYDELRVDFLTGSYSAAGVDVLLDTWVEQIEPFVAEAASANDDAISVDDWRAEVEALRADVAAERAR